MAQIINSPRRSAYAGQAAGSSLSQALQGLAGNFVNEFSRNKQRTLFEKNYPEHADILAQFHDQPAVQQKLLSNIDKQRMQQQQLMQSQLQEYMKGLQYEPNNLLERGYPQELVRQIAAAESPKLKESILGNYHKNLNKPILLNEAASGYLPSFLGTKKRLPGIGEENRRSGETQQFQELRPSTRDSSLTDKLKSLRPGLAATGIAEGLLSLPHAAANLPNSLINLIPNLLGYDNIVPAYGNYNKFIKKTIEQSTLPQEQKDLLSQLPNRNNEQLPSPAKIRKHITTPLARATGTEKTFLPQNENEEAITRIFSEASPELAQALASGGIVPIAKGVVKGLARSFGANAAGWLTQNITGSERAGNLAKIATYLASSFAPGLLNRTKNAEYKKWDTALENTKDKTIPISPVNEKLLKIQEQVRKMDSKSPSAEFMRDRLGALEEKFILDPKLKQYIKVDDLAALRKSQSKLYPAAVKAGAEKEFIELLSTEKDLLSHWAKQTGNAESFKSFENANQIVSGLKQAGNIKDFLQGISPLRGTLFALGVFSGGIPTVIKSLVAAGYTAHKALSHIGALLKVRAIRREYANVLKYSVQHNGKAAALALQRFENLAKKKDPELVQSFYKNK